MDIAYKKSGLKVSFRTIRVPVDSTYHWDFGDLKESTDKNPEHIYEVEGFYDITLKVTDKENKVTTVTTTVAVTNVAKTTLSGSIYDLMDTYAPDILVGSLTYADKRIHIEKWQLYLQPLVNHEIPLEEYANELYYEALENQLIMELATYDWLSVEVMNLMRSTSAVNSNTPGSSTTVVTEQSEGIKKIVTGPSEVEFYENKSEQNAADVTKAINSAMKPGGIIDTLKENICNLSIRLNIFLPFCKFAPKGIQVPEVSNVREPGLLGGPNPPLVC